MSLMQQRSEQECHLDEQLFFKPSNMAAQNQNSQDSFFMNIGTDAQLTPSSASSLFMSSSITESCAVQDGTSQFVSSPSLRPKQYQVSDPFLQQSTSETVMGQKGLLAQHEDETLEIQNQDKMNTLHSRLHQEADKIRRWKVQIEMEVRQKERGLSDAQQTIESQRKSLLELQLQNEKLSVRLQEEIENRIDISQKIVSTRDMCALVKDYASKLEGKLVENEQVREELQDVGQKQLEDMKNLESRFKDLSLAHSNKVNELKSELHKEKKTFEEVEQKMQTGLSEMQKECESLQSSCEKKDRNISELQEDIKKTAKQLAMLQQEKEGLQESLNQANEEVEANKQLLAKIKGELREADKMKSQLQTTQAELEKNIEALTQDAEQTGKQIEDHKNTIEQCQEHIKTKEKTITDLEQRVTELEAEKAQLGDTTEEQNKTIQRKAADVDSLKGELKEVLEREKASYDKLDSMRKDLQSESSENAKLVEVIGLTRKEKHTLEEQLGKAKDETEKLADKVQHLESDILVEKTNLQTVLEVKEQLEKEKADLQSLHEKHSDDAGQHLKKEKKKTADFKKELDAAKASRKGLEKEIDQLRKQKEEAEKKQELATAAQEEQAKKFEQVMNTYMTDYDKIVMEKTNAVDDLKRKLLEQVASTKEQEGRRIAMEEEVAAMKQKVTETETARSALERDTSKTSEELASMKEQLKEKVEEITRLHEEARKAGEEKARVEEERAKAEEEKAKAVKAALSANKKLPVPSPRSKTSSVPSRVGPMTPVTPSARNNLSQDVSAKALRTPLAVKAVTPRTTPQRSILKQAGLSGLKRRVAFASDDRMEEEAEDDCGGDSDSSTSQLMEFEFDEIDERLKLGGSGDRRIPSHAVTPMRVHPSPQVGQQALPGAKKKPVGAVQRSQGSTKTKMPDDGLVKERQQYQDLYPEVEDQSMTKKQKQANQSTKNARKTPKRAYKIKGWGDSPRGRKKKKDTPVAKDTKENNLEWFDNDAVYGFFD